MDKKILHTFVILAYKESKYLENCIISILNQKVKQNVIIATSTPNEYIEKLAKKYDIDIIENMDKGKGIGYDFDFAAFCAKTPLVTIAHQDDIYEENYAEKVIENFKKHQDAIIMFSDYYEIRDEKKQYTNLNLKIKKILLFPLRIKCISGFKWCKRLALRFGCAICCPSVTFSKNNIDTKDIFKTDLKSNVDWFAWEKLSHKKGKFIYINKYLMGHRVHDESTTTAIIKENTRTKEDYIMFCKFWPKCIVKIINKFYAKSEISNKK